MIKIKSDFASSFGQSRLKKISITQREANQRMPVSHTACGKLLTLSKEMENACSDNF